MNTGPEWLCQPLADPAGKVIVCTATSSPGFPFNSRCQSPVLRFTVNIGSLGSLNVARPRGFDMYPPLDAVNAGAVGSTPVERVSAASLPLEHATMTVTS